MSSASFDALGTDRDLGSDGVPARGLPRLRVVPPAGERDRPLRRPSGVLGRRHRDGLEGLRAHLHSARGSRPGCLGQMAGRFAMMRGSRIASFGSADLVRLDAAGRKRWLMQADEVLYLHPDGVRLQGPAIDVDADPLPEVVLEVDHTTDVRRRKLGIYKESGFPEIWVLVPWEASVRRPGLTIHVRRGGEYREEAASRAFPGWKAEEIHRALTEAPMSETAWRALERTALAMGEREGTTPQHDPLMASERRKGAQEVDAQGHREGRAQGHRCGRPCGRSCGKPCGRPHGRWADILASRGIELTLDMTKPPGAVQRNSGNGRGGGRTSETDFPRAARHAWAERPHPAASTGDLMRIPAGSSTEIESPSSDGQPMAEPVAARRDDRTPSTCSGHISWTARTTYPEIC